ncbi:MAG: UbiA family prenyltransferase, partial [Pseudomonadota bacterium]
MSSSNQNTLHTGSLLSEFTHWRAYLALCKPKVVALIVFTAFVGMLLAVPGFPPLDLVLFATLGIGMAASSAAAINHILDRDFDQHMGRTADRPLPTGQVGIIQATVFALSLGILSMLILALLVNVITAMLTLATLVGYAIIYTRYLKHMTPQNIVIGGAA